jgi:hypothetical protein
VTEEVRIPGYRVLRTLGVGGMATVYLAEQQSLEREVALKVMSPTLAANTDFCEQFLKEGRITAKLTHPNLVTVHDIGSHRGIYYMASEYLPAGSLRERLQPGMDVTDALEIARDIASGLNYAHEMGFVHRDVKPGNILFRTSGSAVLADFGIAKAIKTISSMTMAGNAIGTPDYMSPEQAQASPVDGRTDLYSLGAVLFEMLTGSKPYIAKDPYAVALRQVTDPVPLLPDALAWLQPLIDMMMAKDRELRCPSGDAFIAACDGLIGSRPEYTLRQKSVTPRPDTRAEPAAGSALVGGTAVGAASRARPIWLVSVLAIAFAVVAALAWRAREPAAPPSVPVSSEAQGRSVAAPVGQPPGPQLSPEPRPSRLRLREWNGSTRRRCSRAPADISTWDSPAAMAGALRFRMATTRSSRFSLPRLSGATLPTRWQPRGWRGSSRSIRPTRRACWLEASIQPAPIWSKKGCVPIRITLCC